MTEFPDAQSTYYTYGRPEKPILPEDRPRGGVRKDTPAYHRSTGATLAMIGAALLVGLLILAGGWILLGIALFP
jgi:hypothetical protein